MTGRWRRRGAYAIALLLWIFWYAPLEGQALVVIEVPLVVGAAPAELRTLKVQQDDEVVLRWTSDAALHLHLHGYDLEAEVQPGRPAEMRFHAHATGRYPLVAHIGTRHRTLVYIEVHP